MTEKLREGQQLWFVDKKSKIEVSVLVNKVYDNRFSFIYKGKELTCDNCNIGDKIYTSPKNPKPIIFFRGELCEVNGEEWIRYDGKRYAEKYQDRLSRLYNKRKKYYIYSAQVLIKEGYKAKYSKKHDVAISYFEIALLKADANDANKCISDLSSLYRIVRWPNASIELYKYVLDRYKHIELSAQFLTSVGAAYLDMGNKEKALQLAEKVFAMLGGNKDEKLEYLFYRIDAQG